MTKIARGAVATPTSELVGTALMLYSVPRVVERTDAIVVFPGLGEDWRLTDAIQAWNYSLDTRHLLIAGRNTTEPSWFLPTVENLSEAPYNLARHNGVVIQPEAKHTRDQADWLVEKIHELGITSLSLFVSPYHLPRAYSTVLASFIRSNVYIPMIPVPVSVSPSTIIPDSGLNAWESVAGEVERIFKYQDTGDVASFQHFQTYLDWLWTHPIITEG